MKFSSILALALCVALVSAAPRRDNNSNRENNSKHINKEINQSIGSVGSHGGNKGLAGGLLGNLNLLSGSKTTNSVSQNAVNN
ncbi:uncharacterized protein B0P05DRAFT_550450 [Gilbertella persicaria]|uniref:uncharacterized protein n=1 Tax=Gilbertella persicaria TaxID=101096 RepID=UPI0022205580|nr:uncharacterized protein B0P05DRAFT_550450 [Gilbertella persicaria]KAI8070628.1 hypothetical protein B0P05DRAFT_550450 [Gilbertella persicaria]